MSESPRQSSGAQPVVGMPDIRPSGWIVAPGRAWAARWRGHYRCGFGTSQEDARLTAEVVLADLRRSYPDA